jgi:two-component system, OmpR family, response regulator
VRLLLVEDERPLAAALDDALREEGWVVDLADNGREGLRMALIGHYDVVVLDIMLPLLNGYDVLKYMRAQKVWSPVLMLTAKDGEYDEAEALDTGADDFLSKPFSFVVLVARLRALIRRGSPPRPAVLEVGTLSLDPATRACARGDTEIRLTPREFALLELLMRQPRVVVPKLELLDGAWGSDFAGDPNVVEVYVRYLRRKIDRPFGVESIETVRGAGYRLRA